MKGNMVDNPVMISLLDLQVIDPHSGNFLYPSGLIFVHFLHLHLHAIDFGASLEAINSSFEFYKNSKGK